MPFVVTEPCVACKHTTCVAVCPMDCFVEGPNFLAIDPDGCIDCAICVPECPVDAIVNATEVDEAQRPYIELNARFARDPAWKPLMSSKAPLPGHEAWAGVSPRAHLIEMP